MGGEYDFIEDVQLRIELKALVVRYLVTAILSESCWTIGRNVKKALPNLKDIGNQSGQGRRYIARKTDLDDVKRDLRLTIEELVNLSKLRK